MALVSVFGEASPIFSTGSTLKKRYYKKQFFQKPLVNHRIRAREVRVVSEKGEQIGVMNLQKALALARERDLDLVQLTKKLVPPVCKITDYGKYLYNLKKKQRKSKTAAGKTAGEIKGIRLSFAISEHDLETRVKQAEKFLNKGYKVRIEMKLRGRQKAYALTDFAKAKIQKFLQSLKQRVPFKIERELRKQARGLTMIISKT